MPHTQKCDQDHIAFTDKSAEKAYRGAEAAMGRMRWSRADIKNPRDNSIRRNRLSERSGQGLTSEQPSVLRSQAVAKHEA
jgi:hypothetical protein